MRYGITGLIATAYTLDKMDQRNGIKTGQTYMGSLPWGKIAFCAGLDIMNNALRGSGRYGYQATRRRNRNSQKASSASWLDEYRKNILKTDSDTSKYHSLQETEISGDWRREELRCSDHKKDEARIEKVYTSLTSDFYYDYDETDCGPDSLSDSYWDYHGYD